MVKIEWASLGIWDIGFFARFEVSNPLLRVDQESIWGVRRVWWV